MSEEKRQVAKPAEKHAAGPEPKLAPASESGDPAVHQLLAELQTARSNGNDDAVQALTGRLAELGFE